MTAIWPLSKITAFAINRVHVGIFQSSPAYISILSFLYGIWKSSISMIGMAGESILDYLQCDIPCWLNRTNHDMGLYAIKWFHCIQQARHMRRWMFAVLDRTVGHKWNQRKQQHIHASIRERKVIPACFQVNQAKNRFSTRKTMYVNSANMLRAIDDITMCNSIRSLNRRFQVNHPWFQIGIPWNARIDNMKTKPWFNYTAFKSQYKNKCNQRLNTVWRTP